MNIRFDPYEITTTVFGLIGAWYMAEEGKRVAIGFVAFLFANVFGIAFAIHNGHWVYLLCQIGFTFASLRGLVKRWLKPWLEETDEWRGDITACPTMLIKHLGKHNGRKADLHIMIAPDAPKCYHTHPARAVRVILWGGYIEELLDGTLKVWRPGMVGLVRPELCHRIHALCNGRSYSLWLRGRKTHEIELHGTGWVPGSEHA
jgi:hypothetical protein